MISCRFSSAQLKKKKRNKKTLWSVDSSFRLDPKSEFKVLINDVADTDGGNNLHEVWCEASVESHRSLSPDDVFEQAGHAHLRAAFYARLCLHSCPDEGEWVAGQLPTGAGGRSTCQEHKHAWIGTVCGEALQPPVLQSLIDGEVDASVWNDAQHVGDIAFVKSSRPFLLEYLFGTIHNA